jgi:hypothetical protein
MQRKGGKLNVHFNNQKETETTGGENYLVEFNNLREVQKSVEPVRVEFHNSKEVLIEKTIKEEEIQRKIDNIQKQLKTLEESASAANQQTLPYITKVEEEKTVIKQDTVPYITKVEEEQTVIKQDTVPYITQVEEEKNVEYTDTLPVQQTDYTYLQQTQTQVQSNDNLIGQDYNANQYMSNGGAITTTTTTTETTNNNMILNENNGMTMGIGYGTNVEGYGAGGYEYTEQNQDQTAQLRSSEVVKQTEFRNSINRAIVNESTKDTLYTRNVLPVKVMEAKVNKVIYDTNVKTLPVIFGGKNVTYVNKPQTDLGINNMMYQTTPMTENYTYEGQQNSYENQYYSNTTI